MTVFFLIAVMEIRREIDEGALSKLDQAILPVGLLAGIGFTMSVFIAMLNFTNEKLLNTAKLGVLLGCSASVGVWNTFGVCVTKHRRVA